jgi:hypothetical protein
MKLVLFSLAFAATLAQGMAFGPAPFRNGSPLLSGTDGVYQAVASGANLTGIFTWAMSGGVQLSSANNNSWVFFVDGNVVRGTTVANVSNNSISGILDPSADFQIPVDSSQAPILPFIRVLSDTTAQGRFSGTINLKSATAAFSGSGVLQGTPPRTYQVLFIDEPVPGGGGGAPTIPPVYQDTITVSTSTTNATTGITTNTTTTQQVLPTFNIPASNTPAVPTNFTFRGTRLSPSFSAGVPVAPTAATPAPQN